jgi:hypothetical protein
MKHDLDHIYNFIVGYKLSHDGNSPSFREIGDACGIASTSMVKRALADLIGNGKLALNGAPFQSRCIEVVGGEWRPPSRSPAVGKS